MKEFKGCIIPDGFDENIELIKQFSDTDDCCQLDSEQGKCFELTCGSSCCILSKMYRPILREYLAMLEHTQHFAVGTIIDLHRKLEVMLSFKDGDELYYAVKRYADGKCDGLYIISEKKLLHDMNQCRVELIAQNKLHQQTIDENKVKIDSLEKLLEGKE